LPVVVAVETPQVTRLGAVVVVLVVIEQILFLWLLVLMG